LVIFEFGAFVSIFSGFFDILLMRKNSQFFKAPEEDKSSQSTAWMRWLIDCFGFETRTLSSGPDTR
jgi:hypothetical protein